MKIEFQIAIETNFGDSVALVGSQNQLGNWNLDESQLCHTDAKLFPSWKTGVIDIENIDQELEFKFVVVNSDKSSIIWESRTNRNIVELKDTQISMNSIITVDCLQWDSEDRHIYWIRSTTPPTLDTETILSNGRQELSSVAASIRLQDERMSQRARSVRKWTVKDAHYRPSMSSTTDRSGVACEYSIYDSSSQEDLTPTAYGDNSPTSPQEAEELKAVDTELKALNKLNAEFSKLPTKKRRMFPLLLMRKLKGSIFKT
eukprot:GHVH01000868.1.p1 GENE.GHVH01000868.1~~GHVH01000868.1.p1  ORF type:complete len:259 (+),score=39.27 GHVH01000868.1:84-860(+)